MLYCYFLQRKNGIRQSLIDFDVISVPSLDRCQVIETPTYMRYAFAAMDSAGALETLATESFYYVTPVEDDWTAQQQEEWLSNFNYDTLKIISIHEVYPGHFVHHLHNRYGRELPLVNRVATSYAFTEGWAHYTEQMMLETRYGEGQPRLLLTQLLEALVRNCRYMCSLWLHTEGMTLDDATRFFMDNAYMAELPARREALRGTFDPGYLNYTLGKLMILKLREDYRREQGIEYSLKNFHDRLLSSSVGMPMARCRPSSFGMYTRRTGLARYAPRLSRPERSSMFATRFSPYDVHVSPSTPDADFRFRLK